MTPPELLVVTGTVLVLVATSAVVIAAAGLAITPGTAGAIVPDFSPTQADCDSGSINPHQLFLIFNELVEAEANPRAGFNPSYMIDQSHNVTDPIESMLSWPEAIVACFA